MSAATASPVSLTREQYQRTWIDSAREVLGQIAGTPFAAADTGSAQTQDPAAPFMCFSVGAPLCGEQSISITAPDALQLSQLLMGEPLEETAAFDADHREALAELFRQIAGAAALALGSKLGQEIEVKLTGTERPAWLPLSTADFHVQLSSARTRGLSLHIQLSAELTAALQAAKGAPQEVKTATVRSASRHEPNVDFLRDVELNVTLRFGTRQVLLRDILEVIPGTVLELEQQIQEPVDLLVGKKVIARGEVVVIDGNYGVRITEVVSPAERLASLRN
jgi:flagellar motor switch protein FliN/FliY